MPRRPAYGRAPPDETPLEVERQHMLPVLHLKRRHGSCCLAAGVLGRGADSSCDTPPPTPNPLYCCQLPSPPRFLTGTRLMLEARTSDQRRECIRRARRVKVTAGDSLSAADGARFLEFFLPFISVDASLRFGVWGGWRGGLRSGLKSHLFRVLAFRNY